MQRRIFLLSTPVVLLPGQTSSPAEMVLRKWLEAFNSGDKAKIEAFMKVHEPERLERVDETMEFRSMTGGFELLKIEKSEARRIVAKLKEKNSPTTATFEMEVSATEPPVIAELRLEADGPGRGPAPPRESMPEALKMLEAEAEKRAAEDRFAGAILVAQGGKVLFQRAYGLADRAAKKPNTLDTQFRLGSMNKMFTAVAVLQLAKKMEESVRAKLKSGAYEAVPDGAAFARQLTEDLQAISKDKHLRVRYSPQPLPAGPPPATEEERDRFRAEMVKDNCGFRKVERLDGNIGYLKFNFFGDPEVCGATASAAMNFVGGVDALIVDLRENGGGDPAMVAYLTRYLFDQKTHLNDIWERKSGTTRSYYTKPDVPGRKLAGKPVYVLTAKRTFSGAEEYAYNLKNLKRATIIGETTVGGAHPTHELRIHDHFMIGVPFARSINPVSKTNWEGTGVEPDVKVAAADAMEEALKLIREKAR